MRGDASGPVRRRVSLPLACSLFVLLDLLFELRFDDVDGGVHIESAFGDADGLVGQMQGHFAGALSSALWP